MINNAFVNMPEIPFKLMTGDERFKHLTDKTYKNLSELDADITNLNDSTSEINAIAYLTNRKNFDGKYPEGYTIIGTPEKGYSLAEGSGIGLGFISLAHIKFVMDFQEVRCTSDEIKQLYLSSLFRDAPISVEGFIYDKDGSKYEAQLKKLISEGYVDSNELEPRLESFRESGLKFGTPISKKLIGSGKQSPIFVYDAAFRTYGVEELFHNCILDHECKHADDIQNGMLLPNGIIINQENIDKLQEVTSINVFEAIAYKTQLDNVSKRGITRADYIAQMEFLHDSYLQNLRNVIGKNDFEDKVIFNVLTGL